MRPSRVGAILSFVLTVQFLLTLLWILLSWPDGGLSGLMDSMALYFRERIDDPLPFVAMNLYNVSFAVSALGLAVVLRRLFADFPHRTDFAFASIVIAASMYMGSGMVPLVAAPGLFDAGDLSALNAIEGIGAGLLLGATVASGFAVATFALVGFASKRLPAGLCALMLAAGIIEMIEWAVPAILILDPLLGTLWSIWLGMLLWNDRVAGPATGLRRQTA